jgi:hypothetical protein
MHPRPARLFLLFLLVALTPGRAAEVSPVVAAGDGTYTITAKATHKFTRNTKKLQDAAMAAATKFCAEEGKQLKVVSVDETKSMYLVGQLPHVTLTFKALAANDPQLAPAGTPVPAPAVAAPKPMTTDELQSELTKLDAMRKKGLLTDAEFDGLKQKILSRF